VLGFAVVMGGGGGAARAVPVGEALSQALGQTQASAVVVDWTTGRVLATAGARGRGDMESATGSALGSGLGSGLESGLRSAVGSAVKPLLLEYALEHGIVSAQTEVYCRRNLHVGARALPCTHPADDPVFTAERALAESCNTWFAAMARRFTGPELEAALREAGIAHAGMNGADAEKRQLAVLGLVGVTASPLELARAYASLLRRAPPDGPVVRGLEDSVTYGMADAAAVKGVRILGKTGTASEGGEAWTHGWFAGAIPGRLVLVVYVPHGDGGTAARLAQRFFQAVATEGQVK
jgi:cell division protein FtsI/penicillin-binding protein 2